MAPEVYDIRDPTTTEEVAARLAAGEPAAFYMGMFTIMQAVGPVGSRSASGSLFWQVKRERPSWSKLPVFLRPRDALRLADFDAVHPAFQGFRRRERFESLWSHGAPMHVVTPLRSGLRLVNDVLVTSSADAAAVASDRTVPARTAAMFWMHDPAWLRLADALARRSLPLRFLVGSSFNDHGKHPPYTLDELAEHTAARDDLAYGFVLHDPLLQDCGGFSSHSLVRLPLRGESPSLVMLRHWHRVAGLAGGGDRARGADPGQHDDGRSPTRVDRCVAAGCVRAAREPPCQDARMTVAVFLAFAERLPGWDQAVIALAVIGLCAVVHGIAYTSAEGALRVQRQLLRRGADVVALAGAVAIVRMLFG